MPNGVRLRKSARSIELRGDRGHEPLKLLVKRARQRFASKRLTLLGRKDVQRRLAVTGVHDLHVWTLTSGMEVCSVHLRAKPGVDVRPILDAAQQLLRERFDVSHPTIQIEPEDLVECEQDDAGTENW